MKKIKLNDKWKAIMAFLAPVLISGIVMLVGGEFDREVFATGLGTALTSCVGVYLATNKNTYDADYDITR